MTATTTNNIQKMKAMMLSVNQPNYVLPKVKENKANGGYLTWGDDNLYPEYLWNLYTNSSVHNALINGKVDYICGEGLASESDNSSLNDFIESCNTDLQSLDDIFRKVTLDNEIFGGFAMQIVYTKLGGKIAEIRYVSIPKFRFDLAMNKLKYARDWTKKGTIKTIEYDLYDENDKTGTKVFYFRGNTTHDTYPLQPYVACTAAIENDIEIANFNLQSIKNGLFPSVMINFRNGQPETEDEEKEIEDKINNKFGGSSNTGKVLITWSDSDNDSPVITPIQQPDLDKMFTQVKESVRDSIFVGHRISASNIFGVMTNGKLGNTNEFNQGLQIFMKSYVKPARKILLRIFNRILSTNFSNCDLILNDSPPLDTTFANEVVITDNMTRQEVREKLVKEGYIDNAELPDGVKCIGDALAELKQIKTTLLTPPVEEKD